MAYLCVIDKDLKSASEIQTASEKLLQESKLTFINFQSFQELDLFIQTESQKDPQKPTEIILSLMVISPELIPVLSQDSLQAIKDKYKTLLVLTPFEDPLKPLKKIETWPIENIIYKPFDLNILQEHLRFAAIQGKKLTALAVHSSKESCEIEKIRRYPFAALSDFSFKIKSKTHFEIGRPYKFYHYVFQNQKKQSAWVKAVYKNEDDYEFVLCAPTTTVLGNLRKKSNEAKDKLKNISFHGLQKNKDLQKVRVALELSSIEEITNLKSFFSRRFPDVEIVELTQNANGFAPTSIHLLISEIKRDTKELSALFGPEVLYFYITNDDFPSRKDAEETMLYETARLRKPLDRHYLSRMLISFIPSLKDTEPVAITWFTVADDSLYSEIIKAQEFSEAAFLYERETILPHGNYQEFALTQEDETELKLLKAKVQYVDEKPQQNKLFLHQVIFYGIRDNLLKQIRLWLLHAHISKKNSEN